MLPEHSTVILIPHDGMGHADTELQRKLIAKYFQLLEDKEPLPEAVCFYTDGVKLVVEGSPLIAQLKQLESRGIRLIICKTCLDHFGLTDRVAVGTVAGMPDIIDVQWSAAKTVTL
jgi:intracellular sulfur oxidation DsrE/DsrF family protein